MIDDPYTAIALAIWIAGGTGALLFLLWVLWPRRAKADELTAVASFGPITDEDGRAIPTEEGRAFKLRHPIEVGELVTARDGTTWEVAGYFRPPCACGMAPRLALARRPGSALRTWVGIACPHCTSPKRHVVTLPPQ